jgi:hypothetical protein
MWGRGHEVRLALEVHYQVARHRAQLTETEDPLEVVIGTEGRRSSTCRITPSRSSSCVLMTTGSPAIYSSAFCEGAEDDAHQKPDISKWLEPDNARGSYMLLSKQN